MVDEQLVFGTTIEGLFLKGLSGKVTPQLSRELQSLGLDLTRPLLPAYPRHVVSAAVKRTAQTLYPEVPLTEAFYRVGKHVTSGQANTLMGAAALKLLGLVGPRRALDRLSRTFRSTNNYMNVALRELSPSSWELELQPSNEYPSYMQAVIEDILALAGARGLVVSVAQHDVAQERCVYSVTWT